MSTDLELYESTSVPALPERLSLPEILKTAEILAASGYFPTAKEAGQAAAKIMWGQDMGLTPMQAMTGIHVWVQGGTPTMQVSAKVITYLLKRHGFTWKFVQHDPEACEVEVYRHGKRLEPNVRFTKQQATKAGLANKQVWTGYGEDMLWHRVAGRIADRFAPEIFDAASIPVMTPEQAEATYPDPRDDLMKALFAAYREVKPHGDFATREEEREQRLEWSSIVLGREIRSWNGHEAPETLTRADVQTLLDELARLQATQPAPAREQAAPALSTPPVAVSGAESTASQSSVGQTDEAVVTGSASQGCEPVAAPAEHHTAEVLGEVAPADGAMPGGIVTQNVTGTPSGPVSTTKKRYKTDPTGAPKIAQGIAENQRFKAERRAQTEVSRDFEDPIQSMPPTFRKLYLDHFDNKTEAAAGVVWACIARWEAAGQWPAPGEGAPWSLELLKELAADTFEKDMYR